MTPTTLSPQGAQFIAGFEGFVAEPYNDAVENATIGYGHLLHTGPVTAADRAHYPDGISKPAALELLERDAATAASAVAHSVHVPLDQAQFDALVSFTYNLGGGALEGSTLVKEINNGLMKSLAEPAARAGAEATLRGLWVEWDHAGGQVLAGLERRREAEATLFLTGQY